MRRLYDDFQSNGRQRDTVLMILIYYDLMTPTTLLLQ